MKDLDDSGRFNMQEDVKNTIVEKFTAIAIHIWAGIFKRLQIIIKIALTKKDLNRATSLELFLPKVSFMLYIFT